MDKITCKTDVVPGTNPFHKYLYRMAPSARKEMYKIIRQQIDVVLTEEANEGAWVSPALLVKKQAEVSTL